MAVFQSDVNTPCSNELLTIIVIGERTDEITFFKTKAGMISSSQDLLAKEKINFF